MGINLKNNEVEIREKRLKSIISYSGSVKDLYEKSKVGNMPCTSLTFSQCGECSAQRVITLISTIHDIAIVNHAPIGCAGDLAGYNVQNREGLKTRGFEAKNINALSTNLSEKETVYGGEKKLRDTILEAYKRFNPKAIFVSTSCASGIIGDDVESVVNATEKEIGIPVIAIYCEGFKSKIWTTGFDATLHAILKKIVKPSKQKRQDLINIFNFAGKDVFTDLLGKIGLKPNYLVPYSTIEQLENMTEAVASTHVCETLGTYIGTTLEEKFGVPEVKAPTPYGIEWTDSWLRAIGKITSKEKDVENLIENEKKRIEQDLSRLREKFKDKKAYVIAGSAYANNLISIANDLGLEVIGSTSFHHDQRYDNDDQRINSLKNLLDTVGDIKNYNVCNKQPYQIVNVLKKLSPDILIVRHFNIAIIGTKIGIPSIVAGDSNIGVGYDGVIEIGERIEKALQAKKLLSNISKHSTLAYKDWWYKQDPFIYKGGKKA